VRLPAACPCQPHSADSAPHRPDVLPRARRDDLLPRAWRERDNRRARRGALGTLA
jgi:hypothetical protein